MSVALVAFRPGFCWTLAIATNYGDIIIRHLPTSSQRLANEKIIYLGNRHAFKSLQWSSDGTLLQADNLIFIFNRDDDCSFVDMRELCPSESNNAIVQVSVDKDDVLTCCTNSKPANSDLPSATKEKFVAFCTVAHLCTAFSVNEIRCMADLIIHMDLNSKHNLY